MLRNYSATLDILKVTGHIWNPMWKRGIRWNVKGTSVTIMLTSA
ncbi:hypothetical protein ACU79I_004371 [Escherichia coli]